MEFPQSSSAAEVIEYDSDDEEQPGADLSTWLAQLQDASDFPGPMEGDKSILTQSHTMESFRYSVMMDLDEGGTENLDDILSDLCALQQEITNTQKCLNPRGMTSAKSDKDSGNGDEVFEHGRAFGATHRYSTSSDYPSSISTGSPPRTVSPDRESYVDFPPPPPPLLTSLMTPLPAPKAYAPFNGSYPETPTFTQGGSHQNSLKKNRPMAAAGPSTNGKNITMDREEKIRIAMQKIKEADIRKLFVKVFIQTGDFKTILVDDRMESFDIMEHLLEKCYFKQNVKWTIIEQIPDLFMERIVEDHEKIVQVMANWLRVSNNKILFLETDDKYDLFFQPQVKLIRKHRSFSETSQLSALKRRLSIGEEENYLLNRDAAARCTEKGQRALINDLFNSSGTGCPSPELEGDIYMKVDGQKTWRKVRVVLRESGLYSRKNKSSKTLTLIAEFNKVEIYRGFNWKKKMRAPSDHCFALKCPKIQKKSKDIKYFCVEDEYQLKKWLMNLRIAKYGQKLSDNFRRMLAARPAQTAGKTDTPSDSSSQSSRDSGFSGNSGSSNSLDTHLPTSAHSSGSALPPPAEFSDLPPPPPELLDDSNGDTPTNTPLHFASASTVPNSTASVTDAFRRLHTTDQPTSPRHSNSSTPRNSVSSADSSTLGSSSPRSSNVPATSAFSSKRPSLPVSFTPPEHLRLNTNRGGSVSRAGPPPMEPIPSAIQSQSQPGTVRKTGPPVAAKNTSRSTSLSQKSSMGFLSDLNSIYGHKGPSQQTRVPHNGLPGDDISDDPNDLPPPPPELMQPEYTAQENHYSVPTTIYAPSPALQPGVMSGLPPPLPASVPSHYGYLSRVPQPPPMHSIPHGHSQYGIPHVSDNGYYASVPFVPNGPHGIPAGGSAEDHYSMGRVFASHQTGTIKRAPPALPKRSVNTTLSQRR